MTVHVLPFWHKTIPAFPLVATTSRREPWRQLSPFLLGPVATYLDGVQARNFENLWQYSKCYPRHVNHDGWPTDDWYVWRSAGWTDPVARRYPMGKGAAPAFAIWDDKKMGYITARKAIYTELYARAVRKTASFAALQQLHASSPGIVLLDYDAYDHHTLEMSLVDVINNPKRKMGHAFVLAMMLEGCLQECLESPTNQQLEMTP